MFTGIITDIGTITAAEERGDLRVTVACGYDTSGIAIGASVANSGVCLTVVAKTADSLTFDVSAETRRRTAAQMWQSGARLNLERALKVGDELGGHIVTGHVDAVGRIASIEAEGDSKRFTFQMPASVAPYVAPKGSICLNGVSLTVNEVSDDDLGHWFTVNIIPHTAEWTTFGTAAAGDEVNIEIDVLARYLFRMNQLKAVNS
ncbi:riboflavin synthase [Sandarakinorhabdus cyanobacteriorum]|uniref:Riboflavin synthase n=1 Tax=Sandarakinorhabdus cyanobacteriorum TaxID=1981098 RepID=A0A255YTJ7_9SPHN|nr:riboflavin synthase [Sandarakinorhabdus cyanobacteriorum]OYQ31994.1 riboflavin synthase [Sandarakinorhabdus cyanobacteriorum]